MTARTLKSFLYEVQEKKDAQHQREMKSKFNDRKNILNLKIVVCIDISGSIGAEQYKSFMQALDKIKGLSMIKVIETDTIVVAMYDYFKNRRGRVFKFQGGGGTDFVKAMQAAVKMKPDAIVWFTDGYDSNNLQNPKIPNAAVLTKDGECKYDWMTVCTRVDK